MRALRKGISPIIATVLLILIAIAAGIVIYAFATGWIGGRLNEGSGPQAVLVVETGYWNGKNAFVLYVRNDGGVVANITRAYITNPDGSIDKVDINNGKGVAINPGNVAEVDVKNQTIVIAGYTYKITLVSTDGAEVTYTVRA